jgi:hypothetical protein
LIIDLRNIRRISYRLNDVDNIDKIEYIISFPTGFKHSFPVHLDRMTGEIIINLPALEDIIKVEFDGVGYVQVTMSSGTIQDLFRERIQFVIAESIEVNQGKNKEVIKEPINKVVVDTTNEVLLSHSNTLQFIMSNVDRNKK